MGRLKWRLKCARGRERWLVTTNFSASSHWYVGYSVFMTLDLTFLEKFKAFSISVDPRRQCWWGVTLQKTSDPICSKKAVSEGMACFWDSDREQLVFKMELRGSKQP